MPCIVQVLPYYTTCCTVCRMGIDCKPVAVAPGGGRKSRQDCRAWMRKNAPYPAGMMPTPSVIVQALSSVGGGGGVDPSIIPLYLS